ncbi:ion transporter [Sunxiuqinia sp. sy24]|uniref:ion transporter n=1 Tax=Sunxiuqinia sp. sy24 TaxID=3461495 RepID=UPI0040458056
MSRKQKLYEIIFEADTPKGKLFDVALLVVILLSIALVILESVPSINANYRELLRLLEWCITILFTAEYILRILVVQRPSKYIFSFYGIIDFLSVLPSYLTLIFVGSQSLVVIRAIRLLRIFRILKLNRYTVAGNNLKLALQSSREKIFVFLFFVINVILIVGTLMYLIEGPENGFTSIPTSIYWTIVTMTTVGYGDISPQTPVGQMLASVLMIAGYAIIAVPTGIVTAEMVRSSTKSNTQVCPRCLHDQHENDAAFCKKCGRQLN